MTPSEADIERAAVPATLVERLRGIVRVPVNDGAGLLDGKDFFERSFPTSNLAREAAEAIERLREALGEIADLTTALRQGGPDPDDLNGLSEALQTATNIAYDALHLADTRQTPRILGIWSSDLVPPACSARSRIEP